MQLVASQHHRPHSHLQQGVGDPEHELSGQRSSTIFSASRGRHG